MKANVADIITMMNTIAPPDLAEQWDNVGLQVGLAEWNVHKIRIALDPTPQVMTDACSSGVDLLITHHPLIFKPLKSIDLNTAAGRIIDQAIQSKTAVFAAHTNLDIVSGGVNDVLADRIGLKNTTVLDETAGGGKLKLVVYVPEINEQRILQALMECGVGVIGEYSGCTFRSRGTGTFKPGDKAVPFSGNIGVINSVEETRIEALVEKKDLTATIAHLRSRHPYETMAYDVYPLVTAENDHGLGRVGELEKDMYLKDFGRIVGERLGVKNLRIAGNPDLRVSKAAVCSGSGSGLMSHFFSCGAQVYISGDLGYHNARDVESRNLGLIDIGHFASEHLIIDSVAKRLRKMALDNKMDIHIDTCMMERAPFWNIDE